MGKRPVVKGYQERKVRSRSPETKGREGLAVCQVDRILEDTTLSADETVTRQSFVARWGPYFTESPLTDIARLGSKPLLRSQSRYRE